MIAIKSLRIFFIVFITILLPIVVQFLLLAYEHQQQFLLSHSFLNQAEKLSDQITSAVKETSGLGLKECSDSNIEILRKVRLQYLYVDDVGLMQHNVIMCTASWGRLNKPLKLTGSAHITPSGFSIYQLPDNSLYSKNQHSSTVMDNVIAIPSRMAFNDFQNVLGKYYISLTTRDNQRVFYRTFSSESNSGDLAWLLDAETRRCSKKRDICVRIYSTKAGLLALHPLITIGILGCGLLFGIFLLQVFRNYRSEQKSFERRFIRAVKRKKLYVVYQPVVRAGDRVVVSYEALVRWNDSRFGMVSPELFIGVAEKLGIYRTISRFVMTQSLQDLAPVLALNPQLKISLNIGDDDLTQGLYLNELCDQCNILGVRFSQVKLEITERCMVNLQIISRFCEEAKRANINISLDDFGTGTSNISWLTSIDFDEIKIDKAFVHYFVDSERSSVIMSLVMHLMSTGKQLVFEGVESSELFKYIKRLNPNFHIQGWYTGRPVAISLIKH